MRFPNPLQSGIYLMKIHGALDIFTFNDGKDLLKLLPLTADWNGFIDVLRAANQDLIYVIPGFAGRVKAANEIAYADEAGEMQFLRRSLLAGAYKFDSRRSQVLPLSMLKHFKENLNFVTTLVCIGYGFGDLHINSILREWLEFIPERSLEIVNLSAKEVPAFLLHLLPQVTITACGATDYLDKQAGIVRTRLERAEKRLANLVRSKRKATSRMLVTAWINSTHQKLASGLSDALRSIPIANGKPDFSLVGDPAEYAQRLRQELGLDKEQLLEELIKRLDDKSE